MITKVVGKQKVLGIGKPDFSKHVSSGRERPGVRLKANEALKLFAIVFSPSMDVATALVGAHSSGEINLTVADATGFWVNGSLVVDPGGANQEVHKITNIAANIITIATGLDNNQGGGTPVIVFNPYPWVVSPLAAGASQNLINQETGDEMPYTVEKGHTLSLIQRAILLSQDYSLDHYFDGNLAMSLTQPSGFFYKQDILGITTKMIDPMGLTSHTMRATLTNIGTSNLVGGEDDVVIEEAVGTPPFPTVKTVKCKFCGHKWGVPIDTTGIICPNCGLLNIYYNLQGLRGT